MVTGRYLMKYLIYGLSIIVAAIVFIAAMSPSYADPPLPTPVARVVWVKGTLTAVMPNSEQRILQKQSVIYLGDMLVTDPTSQAQIVFTDNTLMTFREDTKFYVKEYSYNPKAKKGGSVGKYVMSLIQGGFRTITGIIAKSNPPDYQVNTPVATIGVRGTDYAVYISNGQLFVGYYTGEPCVTSENKTSTVCLDQQNPYVKVENATSIPVPVPIQPDGFKQKLEVLPAKITAFTGPGSMPPDINMSPKGPITSFCITQ